MAILGDQELGSDCEADNLRQASATRVASTLRSWVSNIFARSYIKWDPSVIVVIARFERDPWAYGERGGCSRSGTVNEIPNISELLEIWNDGNLQAAWDELNLKSILYGHATKYEALQCRLAQPDTVQARRPTELTSVGWSIGLGQWNWNEK